MYVCVQGLSELAVEQERDRSEKLLQELSEREAEKTERRMEEQHTRYTFMWWGNVGALCIVSLEGDRRGRQINKERDG